MAAAHYVLKAAEHLNDEEDLEAGLFLIGLGRRICRDTLNARTLSA
jgi:hypothetical protein